ncbi:MAG: hypothetical protein WCK65_10780 [Rhodospirillaceae bacterium]
MNASPTATDHRNSARCRPLPGRRSQAGMLPRSLAAALMLCLSFLGIYQLDHYWHNSPDRSHYAQVHAGPTVGPTIAWGGRR